MVHWIKTETSVCYHDRRHDHRNFFSIQNLSLSSSSSMTVTSLLLLIFGSVVEWIITLCFIVSHCFFSIIALYGKTNNEGRSKAIGNFSTTTSKRKKRAGAPFFLSILVSSQKDKKRPLYIIKWDGRYLLI